MKIWGAAIGLSLMLAAVPAKAATYIGTVSGNVVTGADLGGLFGSPSGSLAGLAYTAVFTFTYPLAGTIENVGPGGAFVAGGTTLGTAVTPVSVVFTLNGVSRVSDGTTFGLLSKGNDMVGIGDYFRLAAQDGTGGVDLTYSGPGIFGDLGFVEEFSSQAGNGRTGEGTFGFLGNINGNPVTAGGTLSISSISFAAAVPEPATWFMMVLGIGMVGSAMRRRAGRKRAIA